MSTAEPAAACLFCRIAAGEIPTQVIARTDRLHAFLDLHPIRPGHALIIPRAHHPYFDDVPAAVLAEMMSLAQRLAPIMRRRFEVERVGLFFTGIHIAHAHAHVVPMHEDTDITSARNIVERPLTFRLPEAMPAEALREIGGALRQDLAQAGV